MDTGAAATLLAAAIGFAGLVYQQARHWRETRRDKVRDAYAEWMGALSRVRRTEEHFFVQHLAAHAELRARATAGDPLALQGVLPLTEADRQAMHMIVTEMEAGRRELDIAYGKVCLLDRDWRRIKAAETVHGIPTLMDVQPGDTPSEEAFNERWIAKSTALGELAALINRTLALEALPSFRWDAAERHMDERQEALHARMRTDRRGRPKRGGA